MADTVKVRFEPKMMIDGKLVDGQAGSFTNINPATEESLGEVSDASKEDMLRAIDAARRAFDETDWSTNKELRKRCLLQGLDDIGLSLVHEPNISAYEKKHLRVPAMHAPLDVKYHQN